MAESPKIGVGVLIFKEGKILMGKRKGAHGNGTWAPPGGNLDFGETIEQCAIRETMEEAGILIKNVRFAKLTEDLFPQEQKHYLTVWVLADFDSGEVQLLEPELCEKWEWSDWDNLPKPLFIPVQNLINSGFKP